VSARAHARQARLAEVGLEGQARIEASRVAVEGDADARQVAEEYLARAGAGAGRGAPTVTVRCERLALSPGPREVASGALAALVALRAALGLGGPEDRLRATESDAARDL